MYYLVGMFTGSSLTVSKPSLVPKCVKSFIRATDPTRQNKNNKEDGKSKLKNAEKSIFWVLGGG